MISAIRTFTTKPRNFIYAAMLSTALVAGAAQTKAQKIDREAVIQYCESHKKDTFEYKDKKPEINIYNLKDAKSQFKERLKTYTNEDCWNNLNSGVSREECEDLDNFLNAALSHPDKKVSSWAAKKKEEFENLKNSEYNQKTIENGFYKTNSKIEKLYKRIDRLESTKDQPRNLLMLLIYKDDYKKIQEINEENIDYIKKDLNCAMKLRELQTQEVLSAASVKKLKSGAGKSVK